MSRNALVGAGPEIHRHGRPRASLRRSNQATIRIAGCDPDALLFSFVTDLEALGEWNDLVHDVVDVPDRLVHGAVWRVETEQGAMRWVSRSTVIEFDPVRRRFSHRSGTDDGNPSFTEWSWAVGEDSGTVLTVSWELHPHTRLRRWFLAPYRSRRLRSAVPTSLQRLADAMERRMATRTNSTTE